MPWRLLAGRKAVGTLLALLGASLAGSCGGGGGQDNDAALAVVDFVFVDRSMRPTAPTGAPDLPRNAQIVLRFSEELDPASVNVQTIRIRCGPRLSDVPEGAFLLDGSTVRFDPTRTIKGSQHPYGLDAHTQFVLEVPDFRQQPGNVVRSRGEEPNHTPFYTTFITGDRWLWDGQPPELLGIVFEPDIVDPQKDIVRGNARFGLRFSEVMDPASFVLGPPTLPLPDDATLDVRFDTDDPVNIAGAVAGAAVAGTLSFDVAGSTVWFEPTFSLGDRPYSFSVVMRLGIKDLAGHPVFNPRTFGPYRSDGSGRAVGRVLVEEFETAADLDPALTDADWGGAVVGELRGPPVTTREARIYSYRFAAPGGGGMGQYAVIPDPLTGRLLNEFVPGILPPTSAGRRVMFAFSETELGARGTITAALWGPDSNATFAARHGNVVLRMGYQKNGSMSLDEGFLGNYAGSPATVYAGVYVVPQRANVGNRLGEPALAHTGGYNDAACWPDGVRRGTWNRPLFDFTGFEPWPAFTTYFDWDAGDVEVADDRVLLFDVSATEADNWQQFRAWLASTSPCAGGLIPGFPGRRLFSTYEGTEANPPSGVANGVLTINPEPTLCDTAFTIVRRITLAQSCFYTGPDHPSQAAGGSTFGGYSDYFPLQLTPAIQAGGARVEVEYQAADGVASDRRNIIRSQRFTGWTKAVDDCDGYANVRWRLTLFANLFSGALPRVDRAVLPILNKQG